MWIVFLVFPFSFFFSLISPCNQNRECERERTQIEHFIELLKLEATDKQNHANKTHTHSRHSRARARVHVQAVFILDKKKKKKIETILL